MDREKVIKRAERIMCSTVDRDIIDSFCEEVIAMLEQEAVKPYHVNTNHEQHWKCGNCNSVISLQDKYCSACGKHILWEGR